MISTRTLDIVWVIAGRIGVALIGLATIRAATTLLAPDEYGALAVLTSIQAFCGMFLISPIGQHINLNTHNWWAEGCLPFRLRTFSPYVLGVAALGAFFASFFAAPFQNEKILAVVMFLWITSFTWSTTAIPAINMLGYRKDAIIIQVLTSCFSLFFSIFLCSKTSNVEMWLTGQALGMVIGAAAATTWLFRRSPEQVHLDVGSPFVTREKLVQFCLPLALAAGLMWAQQSGYRFLVQEYWGLGSLALIALGFLISNQAGLLIESLCAQIFYPYFYKKCAVTEQSEELSKICSDLINSLLPVYIIACAFIFSISPLLVKLFAGKGYESAMPFIAVGAGVELARLAGNLFATVAQATKKSFWLVPVYGLGAITTFAGLLSAHIFRLSLQHIAVIILISGVLMSVAMFLSARIRVSISINRRLLSFCIVSLSPFGCLFIISLGLNNTLAILGLGICGAIAFTTLVTLNYFFNPAVSRLHSASLKDLKA